MYLYLLAYFGGLLTILSPCILPVLPFVFSRAGNSFRKTGLPLLLGMGATFVLISSLAVVGGDWVIHANQLGRTASLVLLTIFALTLIFPEFADKLLHPLIVLGTGLSQKLADRQLEKQKQELVAEKSRAALGSSGAQSSSGQGITAASGVSGSGAAEKATPGFAGSFALGIATGLLWAPCAGPILGLILTGAAIQGANLTSSTLLLAYALGAMTSLSVAIFAGNRALKVMRNYLGADRYVRRVLGSLVLLGVLTIALGWDQGILTQLSRVHTESFEQSLIGLFHPSNTANRAEKSPAADGENADLSQSEGPMAELDGAKEWINSAPLTKAGLKGKVVLIDFWTYSCINCLRTLPYIKSWAEKYRKYGLVVIGVHTPEFAFEKRSRSRKKGSARLGRTLSSSPR